MQCLQKEAVEYKGDKSFRYIGILEAEREWIEKRLWTYFLTETVCSY